MSGLGGAVAIIGTGTITFEENFHQSPTDMIHNLGGPGSVSAVAVLSQP